MQLINYLKAVDQKLQALSLANDCYKYKMDLLTNASVLSDAIKFVENSRDKLEAATQDISLKKVREDCITDKNEKNDIQGSSEANIGNISSARTTNQTFQYLKGKRVLDLEF